jgi:hypothetical protein
MDEELVRALVDTIDRADLDTGLVLHVDTRLGDDIWHGAFSPVLLSRFFRRPGNPPIVPCVGCGRAS